MNLNQKQKEEYNKYSNKFWLLFNRMTEIWKEALVEFWFENYLKNFWENKKPTEILESICWEKYKNVLLEVWKPNILEKAINRSFYLKNFNPYQFGNLSKEMKSVLANTNPKNIPKELLETKDIVFIAKNLNKKPIDQKIELYKFYNKVWNSFSWLSYDLQKEFVSIEKIPKWLENETHKIILKFYKLPKEEFEKYQKMKNFMSIYGANYWNLLQNKKEILLNYKWDFPKYFEWEEISVIADFLNKPKEEYFEFKKNNQTEKDYKEYFWKKKFERNAKFLKQIISKNISVDYLKENFPNDFNIPVLRDCVFDEEYFKKYKEDINEFYFDYFLTKPRTDNLNYDFLPVVEKHISEYREIFKKYWKKFPNLSLKNKKEIVKYWFDNCEKDFEHNLEIVIKAIWDLKLYKTNKFEFFKKHFLWQNLVTEILPHIKKEKFSYFFENYAEFCKEFRVWFPNLLMKDKEEMCEIWLKKLREKYWYWDHFYYVYSIKNLSEFSKGKEFKINYILNKRKIVNLKYFDDEFKWIYKDYKNIIKFYWQNFNRYNNDIKFLLLSYWFENLQKDFKWEKLIDAIWICLKDKKDFNLYKINKFDFFLKHYNWFWQIERLKIEKFPLEFQDYLRTLEYCIKKFWSNFWNCSLELKNRFYLFWIKNLEKYFKEEKIIWIIDLCLKDKKLFNLYKKDKIKFFKENFLLVRKIINIKKENFPLEFQDYFENYKKFFKKFKQRFSNLNENNISFLLNYWFEKFIKYNEKYWKYLKDNFLFAFYETFFWKQIFNLNENWRVFCNHCLNEIDEEDWMNRVRNKEFVNETKIICSNCTPIKSVKSLNQIAIVEFIKSFYDWEILEDYRYEKWISKKEIDIFLKDLNIAVEYNWTYWHAEKRNHKYEFCLKNNIDFMIIWSHREEEWREILKNKILWLTNFTDEIITLENMYFNKAPVWYIKIWEISQTSEADWKNIIYNLWKTIYKRVEK